MVKKFAELNSEVQFPATDRARMVFDPLNPPFCSTVARV
jgi:hypothetical protein